MSREGNSKQKQVVFWFRRDLRHYDNHGFFEALTSGHKVLPVFIFDQEILGELEPDDRRVVFIHRTLQQLKEKLRESGGDLHVFHGTPADVFSEVLDQHLVQAVYTNHDYEPYAKNRDEAIGRMLKDRGVAFHTFKDQVMFERDDVLKPDGKPYTIYTPYSKKWLAALEETGIPRYPSELKLDALSPEKAGELPSMKTMGFNDQEIDFPSTQVSNDLIENYGDQRDFPDRPATSRLGVHLRFGTVSIRDLVQRGKNHGEVWLKQLIWREFFMSILHHFPHVVTRSFRPEYDRIEWENDPDQFEKWCEGKTGYPMVDAGMRELLETGHMHNRVRMVVASFLSKHLLVDWRWGEAWFAQHLLDFELASNNGSWQWAAGTGCDAAPYFRVFNPERQMERFDPDLKYVRRWVPEFDDPFQYPRPIVEHAAARDRAIARYAKAVKK